MLDLRFLLIALNIKFATTLNKCWMPSELTLKITSSFALPSTPSIEPGLPVSLLPTSLTTQIVCLGSVDMQGTFPWETYPSIPSNFTHLVWYTWTTTPIFSAITEYKMYEYGLYLPALSYFYLFTKSSPFFPPSQIACIKVDLAIRVPPCI